MCTPREQVGSEHCRGLCPLGLSSWPLIPLEEVAPGQVPSISHLIVPTAPGTLAQEKADQRPQSKNGTEAIQEAARVTKDQEQTVTGPP